MGIAVRKGVLQYHYAIALIVCSIKLHQVVIDTLEVDRGDVVGKWQQLIAMQVMLVFVGKLFGGNKLRTLHHACEEGARTRKRIDNVDALTTKMQVELALEDVVDRVVDEIHDLNWGVHDTKLLLKLRESHLKEALEEIDDHTLTLLHRGNVDHAIANALVEGAELLVGIDEALRIELLQHIAHRTCDRIVLGEREASEDLI